MYFEGIITIDPAQLTKVKYVKPTKAFRKFLHSITLGTVSDKEERETFTAVGILQQINASFRNLGVTNIIKISHDKIDFYHDKEGKENDLKLALDKYEIEVNEAMSVNFSQLNLVLEHSDETFKYLFEITINRDHKIGVYPIEIKVSGLLNRFTKENAKAEIKNTVQNQDVFDSFVKQNSEKFEHFLNEIKFEIKRQIQVDDIKVITKTKYILPSKTIKEKRDYAPNPNRGGAFGGYYGFNDYIFYSLIWSDIMHPCGTTIHNSHFENEYGEPLGYAEKITTDNEIFNSETCDEQTVTQALEEDPHCIDTASNDDTSSWFDFSNWGGDSDSSFFDWDSSSSCSSCSGCSSCGGD